MVLPLLLTVARAIVFKESRMKENTIIEILEKTITEFKNKKIPFTTFSYNLQKLYNDCQKTELVLGIEEQTENRERLSFVNDFCAELGKKQISQEQDLFSESVYKIYNFISKIYCFLTNTIPPVDSECQYLIDGLNQSRFVTVNETISPLVDSELKDIWESLDTVSEQCVNGLMDYAMKRRVRTNFSVYDGPVMPNQIHLNDLDDNLLDSVGAFLQKSKLETVLKNWFGGNIGVANVRCWRYFHLDEIKNTEKFPFKQINAHVDRIAPESLKIMVFRGEITEEDGCFEILPDHPYEHTVVKVLGNNPVAICDVDKLYHKAEMPVKGKERDAIEITIVPRFEDDLLVTHGGWHAGRPLNPFSGWRSEKI